MILNNYWKLKAWADRGGFAYTNKSDTSLNIIGRDGIAITTNVDAAANGNIIYLIPNMNLRDKLSVIVGTGDTEPTADDYDLDSDCTSSISSFTETFNTNATDGKLTTVATVSGQNNTGSTITIKEVGILKTFFASIASTPQTSIAMMLRHVLVQPKEVPANEGFSLTFEWDEA